MKVERVTVSFEVSRSRNYQSVKYSLSEVHVWQRGGRTRCQGGAQTLYWKSTYTPLKRSPSSWAEPEKE
jgi:hypothetical protein